MMSHVNVSADNFFIISLCFCLPGERDVVGEEGGPVGVDDLDGQPQHEQHRAPKDHHGGEEAPGVSHDGQVDHLGREEREGEETERARVSVNW